MKGVIEWLDVQVALLFTPVFLGKERNRRQVGFRPVSKNKPSHLPGSSSSAIKASWL